MQITFLGTSSMVPTKQRNVSAVYVEHNGEGVLLDCGEGTQRQMNIAGINRLKVKTILITHWHADHTAGLIGLIQTMSNRDTEAKVHIIGPKGTKEFVHHVLQASYFDNQLDMQVSEVDAPKPKHVLKTAEYEISAVNLEHGVPVLGFSIKQKDRRRVKLAKLQEAGIPQGPLYAQLQQGSDIKFEGKTYSTNEYTNLVSGKKLTYVTDTLFDPRAIDLAQDSDLLICEATYANNEEEKAQEYHHMTAGQSGQIASMANVKQLYLTHFSQRYKTLDQLESDAKDIFPNTQLASDFAKIKL